MHMAKKKESKKKKENPTQDTCTDGEGLWSLPNVKRRKEKVNSERRANANSLPPSIPPFP
jgi:hypothetical protein